MQKSVTLYHCPKTRSAAVLNLLLELEAPYELKIINLKAGEHRQPAYLAVNPMGKVPALHDGDTLITEQVAILLYLADRFPNKKLAPTLDDPLRGSYLRWMVFYAACMEPACIDRALKRDSGEQGMSPYGSYDTTISAVVSQLTRGPWLLGERFTAADVLWGTALTWMTGFGIVEPVPVIKAYVDRWSARESVKRVAQIDAELAAKLPVA